MALDVVGLTEISERLKVPLKTVQYWRLNNKLPPEEAIVSGRPVWQWTTIEKWDVKRSRPVRGT